MKVALLLRINPHSRIPGTEHEQKKEEKIAIQKTQSTLPRLPGRVIRDLAQIQPLLNRREWDAAIEQLEELHARFPSNVEVLTELVNACYETNDIHQLLRYVRKLHPLMRRDGDVALNLGGAYMAAGCHICRVSPFARIRAQFSRSLSRGGRTRVAR
ncbi:MAG: hypothetical protein R2911_43025 [Caldilineaceae bacterium]